MRLPVSSSVIRHSTASKSQGTVRKETLSRKSKCCCVLCKKKFMSHSLLLKHFDVHLSVVYNCTKCSKSFSAKNTFEMHIKTHLKGAYICELCSKDFDLRSSWYNHMKSHQMSKYFVKLWTVTIVGKASPPSMNT